jgi:hypothetical protein
METEQRHMFAGNLGTKSDGGAHSPPTIVGASENGSGDVDTLTSPNVTDLAGRTTSGLPRLLLDGSDPELFEE